MPAGVVPSDGDHLIPNPATPTGRPVGPPSSCTVTFSAAAGASSSTVNSWISAHQNALVTSTTMCLSGTFSSPIHVWGKSSKALLEIAPVPGAVATLRLGSARPADIDPNQYWSDAGGMSIVDSRGVEVFGLTIEGYTTDGTAFVPAGIYVTVRSDTSTTDPAVIPHRSACFDHGGSCSDIYLIDNVVKDITNSADEHFDSARCDNPNVNAYGIAVIAAGSDATESLQHVVVEGNTVTGTRTGQSETTTFNGNLTDFLVAANKIHDVDNIGVDTIGWETGANQASHGLIEGNLVYNVDTLSNDAYGRPSGSGCVPQLENAAGIYDDGASFVWIDHNTVWNTDQGINLDVETPGRHTDHLLVSHNVVHDDPGTSAADPSQGTNPPGVAGASTVAGHDPFAFYLDAFGTNATISDVYAHDNSFQNESQHFLVPADGMPVMDLGGKWSNVELWHNSVLGEGPSDRFNPLIEVDQLPSGGSAVINCNDYADLSTRSTTVNGNFASPSNSWLTLADWQAHNGRQWDRNSAVGGFSPSCPSTSIP